MPALTTLFHRLRPSTHQPTSAWPSSKLHHTSFSIAAFVLRLSNEQSTTPEDWPELLLPIVQAGWTWPRTDLQHWIVPLNRFDQALEKVVADYRLDSMEHPQLKPFDDPTKKIVLAILAFVKVLLENSTNRKIFSSFDRLNDLLHTTDLEVLLATLRLALRPAQQFSSTNTGLTSFAISEKRLLNLAQGWGTREYALEMVDLAADDVEIPPELDEVEWQFYKKALATAPLPSSLSHSTPATGVSRKDIEDKGKGKEPKPSDTMDVEDDRRPGTSAGPSSNVHSTPAPKRQSSFHNSLLSTPLPSTPGQGPSSSNAPAPQEGLTTIHLGNVRLSNKSAVELLVEASGKYSIPNSSRLELLQKIRIAKAMRLTTERRTLLLIRLLAMTNFAHTTTEAHMQTRLFLYEPDLITHLAELVHPDRAVPIEIQAASFYALEALAHFKTKLGEVASALNASVSHGILMHVFRRTVADFDNDNAVTTHEFVDSLFTLLVFFQTNAFVGNQIVAAGIVPMLVDLIKNTRRDRVWIVTKAVLFLDSLMYGYQSAFTLFISSGGLPIFVERIKQEVDRCLAEHRGKTGAEEDALPIGMLSFDEASLLKGLLRSIQRLMQTSGMTEGLRNLIDTSLLGSVKTVLQNRPIFGAQVFALAINITATFVHNEPTCLATIQEAKVPEALYDAIGESIPASIDVLQAIPNAVGALCLNAAGLALFNERPIIAKYFSIFTSERHVRALTERANGNLLGTSIDELIRHHPSLKEKVFKSIMQSLKDIRDNARSFKPDSPDGYLLQVVREESVTSAMTSTSVLEGTASVVAEPTPAPTAATSTTGDVEMQDAAAPKPTPAPSEGKDNVHLQAIDAFGRFLEGLFQHMAHGKDFARHEPYDLLLDLLSLPCMPSYAPGTGAYSSISAIFRMLSEFKGVEAVSAILKRTKVCFEQIEWLTSMYLGDSKLSSMISPTDTTIDAQNGRFRELCILLSHITLLSDTYGSLSYTHGRLATSMLSVLTTPENATVLKQLSVVLAATQREGWYLQGVLPEATDPDHAVRQTLSKAPIVTPTLGETSIELVSQAAAASIVDPSPSSTPASTPSSPTAPNVRALKEVILAVPQSVQVTLQCIIKLLVHRRSNDAAHRTASKHVSTTIARNLTDLLRWPGSSDLSSDIAYATNMFRDMEAFLFDPDRPLQSGLQTLLVATFIKVGGLEAYLALFDKLQDVVSEDASGGFADVLTTFGALKIALETLNRLTSHRMVLESSQTAQLLTRERDRSSPDYFDPHAFLVQLRATILPHILQVWNKPWLRQCPPNVVRSIVGTLVGILKAQGESAVDPASTGHTPTGRVIDTEDRERASAALDRLSVLGGLLNRDRAAAAAAAQQGPPVVDQTRIAQLVDMGFPRSAVELALQRCRNNVGFATEYLLQHPDLVGAARAREAAQASAAEVDNADAEAEAPVNPPADEAPAQAQDGDAAAPANDATAADNPAARGAGDGDVELEIDIVVGEDTSMDEIAAAVEQELAGTPVIPAPTPEMVETRSREQIDEENKATQAKLDELRDQFKPEFLNKALVLAEDFGDLVFDIKSAFTLLESGPSSLKPLLEGFQGVTFVAEDGDERKAQDNAAAVRWRVIALVLVDQSLRQIIDSNVDAIVATLTTFQREYASRSPDKDSRPKWLASVMLVADSVFSIGEAVIRTTVVPPGDESSLPKLATLGSGWDTERSVWLDSAMDVLKKGISDRETFVSTVRLLMVLTRDHGLAARFVAEQGLEPLLAAFAVERPETAACRAYVTMILRHIVEDASILLPIMEYEIKSWFSSSRSKIVELAIFLRGLTTIAFRSVSTFLEAVKTTCKLTPRLDSPNGYQIGLQMELQPSSTRPAEAEIRSPIVNTDAAGPNEMSIDEAVSGTTPKTPSKLTGSMQFPPKSVPAHVEALMQTLLTTAIDATKAALVPIPVPSVEVAVPVADPRTTNMAAVGNAASTSTPVTAPDASKNDTKDAHIPADVPLGDYYQGTYALSALAELVAAYPVCKTSLLSFSNRRPKDPSSTGPVKPKLSFLHFILNDLLPVGSISTPSDFESRRRTAISNVAALVAVALCHDPTPSPIGAASADAQALELTNVRKSVLDSIARAFRDATASSEPMDIRYSRLLMLSELCHRLLSSRPFASVNKGSDETSMQIAKMMLEKNFAGILTNALAEVDLNFPSVNNLINSILRPLEQLTKVVTKVGRRPGATEGGSLVGGARRSAADIDDSTDMESSIDEDDIEEVIEVGSDEEEQEPPDLYRNSALGMYEGELEPGNHEDAYMTGESEDYDDEDDMMDEMDDGPLPGSDVSDISDDEDEDAIDEAAAMADEMEMRDEMDDDDDDSDDDDHDHDSDDDDSDLDNDDDVLIHDDLLGPGSGEDGENDDDDNEGIEEIIEEGEIDGDDDGWVDEDEGDLVINDDADLADIEAGFVDHEGTSIRPAAAEDDDQEGDSEDPDSYTDEEEHYIAGELEFDAEMTDQLRAAQGGGGAFNWGQLAGDNGRRARTDIATDADVFGNPRRNHPSTQAAAAHPLLVETPSNESGADSIASRRDRGAGARGTPEYEAWANNIERMLGPGGVDTLHQLLGQHGLAHLSGPDQLRVGIAPGPDGGLAMVIDPTPFPHTQGGEAQGATRPHRSNTTPTGASPSSRSVARQLVERLGATSEFYPVQTTQRWHDEGKLIQGAFGIESALRRGIFFFLLTDDMYLPIASGAMTTVERSSRLTQHVINALIVPARQLAQKEKEADERHSKENADDHVDTSGELASEDEEDGEEVDGTEDGDDRPVSEPMDVEATPAQVVPAVPVASAAPPAPTPTATATAPLPAADVQTVVALARSLAAGLAVPSSDAPDTTSSIAASSNSVETSAPALTLGSAPISSTPAPMDEEPAPGSTEASSSADEPSVPAPAEASGSSNNGINATATGAGDDAAAPPAERVIIQVRGRDVDITDTGIDPTFLEALPDDMREEVLNQHFREARSTGPPPPVVPVESNIDTTFLDALPPEIRAEVLQQEAAQHRRERARDGAATAGAQTGGRRERADPGLEQREREADLLFGAGGLPNIVAQARGAVPQRARARGQGQGGVARQFISALDAAAAAATGEPAAGSSAAKKAPAHREAIQLLDKAGLATLVRLLFFPQPLRRNSLQKVLVNLCENSRTRTELITLLLTILQDGTRDVSAVDKSFSQMSLRASKSLTTSKDTPRRRAGLDTPGGTLPHFPGESVPNLIAQRCLEALMYLVAASEQASLFFLAEQELRRSWKKGKGKEKVVPHTTYPIIVLLGLLDRPALLKTQSMMDYLTNLTATITRSLSALQKKSAKASTGPETTTTSAEPTVDVGTSGAVLTTTAATSEPAQPREGVNSTEASSGAEPASTSDNAALKDSKDATPADALVKSPPQIPASVLRLVVNVLDAGECSSKTFQQTLILIQHLSYLPDAREIISEELRNRAQALADSILPDLDELLQTIQGSDQVRGATLAKFSPASASQAKLLRILKTIDWVNGPQKKSPAASEDLTTGERKLTVEEEKVREVFHGFRFDGLWSRLSESLLAVEARPELLYLATVLLPLIESLMVVSKYAFVGSSTKADEGMPLASPQIAISPTPQFPLEDKSMGHIFLKFTDAHRKILNTMVKNNPSLLSGSFSILIHNPKVLEFENKRAYFFSRLHDRSQRRGQHYGNLAVNVRRSHVFEDSFRVFERHTGDEIKFGKLNVKFYNEEGVDAGGVTREWFSALARQMFNPGYALFQPQAADSLTYQPNKSSSINELHLAFFKFVGHIIGKALHDQRVLEAYFSRSVYKHMLGKRIDHNDLESIDPEYHKSLVWMLENDIDGVIDLTFSIESDDFGVTSVVDLLPNGRNIPVTNANKHEYVRLIADQRLSIEIKDQIDALLKGLYEIVPKDLMRIFSERELELLISGLPEIDVDEWRANTNLVNFTSTDPVIGYFWRAVRSFSHEERAKLLQFVSGSSRVPLEGFASLQGMSGVTKFSIHSAGASKALPTAHTCFNQLDLPTSYQSYEELRKALLTSITEGAGSFGFA
ncbi:BQ2448_3150 [Microbotryum intermedium]|uniref:HECT-type E3 ubiquitin transferase n=1 Tax=Microbotryum intermedium TaxID=269621 RepID=A0A238FCK0_9BASI|nr:BQ2448_3150 [Microbotryum intermedium]